MVSLGVALMLRELANQFGWLTGGADGLQGVVMQPILGLFRFDMFGHNGFVYCLVVLFVLFLVARRLANSPFGLSLVAIKNKVNAGNFTSKSAKMLTNFGITKYMMPVTMATAMEMTQVG